MKPRSMEAARDRIHAVAFRRGDWWVAQCLEVDVATQARSLEDLVVEIESLLAARFALADEDDTEPLAGLSPAPQKFWDMYERARLRVSPVESIVWPVAPERRPRLEVRSLAA